MTFLDINALRHLILVVLISFHFKTHNIIKGLFFNFNCEAVNPVYFNDFTYGDVYFVHESIRLCLTNFAR